jgi:alpha-tubulin suppressor-like RCC1 family protein
MGGLTAETTDSDDHPRAGARPRGPRPWGVAVRRRLLLLALPLALVSSNLVAPAYATGGPAVTSLSTTSGPLVGGGHVTVHGSGFSHVREVLFGGAVAHDVHVVSSRALTVVVPRHKVATVNVRVVTATATSKTAHANRFTYVPVPVVSSVAVTSGATTGGTRIVVRGQHFLHVHSVLFGTTKGLAVRVASSSSLSVTTPAHLAGLIDVRVVSAFGSSVHRANDRFQFVLPTGPIAPIPPTPTPTPTPTPPAPPAPVVTTVAVPAAVQGERYGGATFTATSGTPPYQWSAHGLPGGLVLSSAGVLSGLTRAAAGVKPVSVTVTDSAGQRATAVVPLTVHPFGGQLFAWGDNHYGQVGNGASGADVETATKVTKLPAVVSVCGDNDDGFAVETDGSVWGWGLSGDAVLNPNVSSSIQSSPAKLTGIPSAAAVACGSLDVYVLTATGTIWAWGGGSEGQLGNGGTAFGAAPAQVPGLTDIVSLATNDLTAYAVRADGTVLAWGQNPSGFIGDGSTGNALQPITIPGLTDVVQVVTSDNDADTWALHADGSVSGWGDETGDALGNGQTSGKTPTPVAIPGLNGTVQLGEGNTTGYALNENGTVLAWGSNNFGQVGNGAVVTPTAPVQVADIASVDAVSSSIGTGLALFGDGTVDGWGYNVNGNVGDGTTTQRTTPVTVTGLQHMVSLSASPSGETEYAVEDQLATTILPPH